MNNNTLKLYIKFIEFHLNIQNSTIASIKSFFDCEKFLFFKSSDELSDFIKANKYKPLLIEFKKLIKELRVDKLDRQKNLYCFRLAFSRWISNAGIFDFEMEVTGLADEANNIMKIKKPSFESIKNKLLAYSNISKSEKNTHFPKYKVKHKKNHTPPVHHNVIFIKILYTGMTN